MLEATGFFAVLDAACERSGKDKESFSIIVKPNFMFMYNVKDPSTYTDPELVEHLMDRMYERGYRNLAVAEARSTYGVFYTNREVATVARHIGYSEKNYRIVDLSLDLEPHTFSGSLGKHYVNREWKAADFRISFAKNKTHPMPCIRSPSSAFTGRCPWKTSSSSTTTTATSSRRPSSS